MHPGMSEYLKSAPLPIHSTQRLTPGELEPGVSASGQAIYTETGMQAAVNIVISRTKLGKAARSLRLSMRNDTTKDGAAISDSV